MILAVVVSRVTSMQPTLVREPFHRPGAGSTRRSQNQELIGNFAAKSRISSLFGAKEFVEIGGLMSYGPSYPGCSAAACTTWIGS